MRHQYRSAHPPTTLSDSPLVTHRPQRHVESPYDGKRRGRIRKSRHSEQKVPSPPSPGVLGTDGADHVLNGAAFHVPPFIHLDHRIRPRDP